MSQHDMDVANGPGLTVRTDMNAALQALASNSVGPLAPATTFPCQWWGDTTANRLKRRDSANTAWIDMGPLDSLSYLLVSGGTLTGPINDAPPQTITSATLTDIGAATSNVVSISGTTTITGLGTIAAGARRTVRFLASLLLTHNVTSLILPGAASITTAANDTADFLSLGSGNWLCLHYSPAIGTIIASGSNANGKYTKWADGTMICEFSSTSSFTTSSAFGALFQSGAANYTYPAAFVGVPTVAPITGESTNALCWGCISGSPSSTAVSIAAVSVVNNATTKPGYIAKGRWF
ncbi:hypothetical protein ACX3YD_22535 [Pseudomonas fluorescens group sp. PF-1]